MTFRATSIRTCVLVLAAVSLGGCMPHTRPPTSLPPAVVSPGATEVFAVGDVADCRKTEPQDAIARRTAALVPEGAVVLGLGDLVYPLADAATLARCYAPTWGLHRPRTLAIVGNHDLVQGSARDFREYFGLDAISTSREFVAYSHRLSPDWLLIALDSNVHGAQMQRQREWLERTLAAERAARAAGASSTPRCLAVMWHTPLYSSGWHRGSGEHMRPLWALLDEHDADFLLSGHEHFYEAYEPFDAGGQRRPDGEGIRQFTVGTGGAPLYGFWRPPYESRARVLAHGVLQLTLAPDRYTWRFIDLDGRVRDAGSALCRGSSRTPAGSRVPAN